MMGPLLLLLFYHPLGNHLVDGGLYKARRVLGNIWTPQLLRQIADGEDYKVPSTIDDPTILDEVQVKLQAR